MHVGPGPARGEALMALTVRRWPLSLRTACQSGGAASSQPRHLSGLRLRPSSRPWSRRSGGSLLFAQGSAGFLVDNWRRDGNGRTAPANREGARYGSAARAYGARRGRPKCALIRAAQQSLLANLCRSRIAYRSATSVQPKPELAAASGSALTRSVAETAAHRRRGAVAPDVSLPHSAAGERQD